MPWRRWASMLFDPPRFIGGLLGAWLPFVQGEGDGLGEAAAGKPPPMPAINQQVLLELQLPSTLYERRTFVTLVQEIDDDVIAVARPMSKTHYFPVRPGVGYKLRYVAPDSAYEIKGTVARVDLGEPGLVWLHREEVNRDRKSTRLNSSHVKISYAVFCLKKKKKKDGTEKWDEEFREHAASLAVDE